MSGRAMGYDGRVCGAPHATSQLDNNTVDRVPLMQTGRHTLEPGQQMTRQGQAGVSVSPPCRVMWVALKIEKCTEIALPGLDSASQSWGVSSAELHRTKRLLSANLHAQPVPSSRTAQSCRSRTSPRHCTGPHKPPFRFPACIGVGRRLVSSRPASTCNQLLTTPRALLAPPCFCCGEGATCASFTKGPSCAVLTTAAR